MQGSADNQSMPVQEMTAWRTLALALIGESPRPQLAASKSKSIATLSLAGSLQVRSDFRLVADIFNNCASVAFQLLRAVTIAFIFFTIPLPFSCDCHLPRGSRGAEAQHPPHPCQPQRVVSKAHLHSIPTVLSTVFSYNKDISSLLPSGGLELGSY